MIGLFDSGLGGLTVAKALIAAYPTIDLLYLGDTARAPYGSKGKTLIQQFAIENTQWLLDHGATMIGIACNTASVAATEELRAHFPHVRIINVIEPVIEAVKHLRPKSIAILCTRGTASSGVYEATIKQVSPSTQVTTIACPLFVPIVEEGLVNSDIAKATVERYLAPLKEQPPEYLILGCTHYPFLEQQIQLTLPQTTILDAPALFVESLQLSETGQQEANQKYYFTDLPKHTKHIATQWVGCGESDILSMHQTSVVHMFTK